jgi:hypothetical protein
MDEFYSMFILKILAFFQTLIFYLFEKKFKL